MRLECAKKRVQVLQQIEIKMVDEVANKGLADFMSNQQDEAAEAAL